MNPGLANLNSIWQKLDALYASNKDLDQTQLAIAKSDLKLFLNGGPLQLRFTMDNFQREINNLVAAGLFNIYTNTTDENLKKTAKQVVKSSLDPILNQSLAFQLISTYNKKNGLHLITSITEEVKSVMKRAFEYYFDYLWNRWITQNPTQDKTIKSGFIPFFLSRHFWSRWNTNQRGIPVFLESSQQTRKSKSARGKSQQNYQLRLRIKR